ALSWTNALTDKSPDGKLRWAALSAQLVLQALEKAFEIDHPDITRPDLVGLVGKVLYMARDRPEVGWVERQPWAHEVAQALVAVLSEHVSLVRKLRGGSARRLKDQPTWR